MISLYPSSKSNIFLGPCYGLESSLNVYASLNYCRFAYISPADGSSLVLFYCWFGLAVYIYFPFVTLWIVVGGICYGGSASDFFFFSLDVVTGVLLITLGVGLLNITDVFYNEEVYPVEDAVVVVLDLVVVGFLHSFIGYVLIRWMEDSSTDFLGLCCLRGLLIRAIRATVA